MTLLTSPAPGAPTALGTVTNDVWFPRLLAGAATRPVPSRTPSLAELAAELERAGLRGRGGAGFPTAVKLRAVGQATGRFVGRPPVVVANGVESEPLSAKDATLLLSSPQLVLDGALTAAVALGADRVIVAVKQGSPALGVLRRAVTAYRVPELTLEVAEVPARYLGGQESALVHWLSGGDLRPTLTPPRPAERGVDGRPTLVDNVETLANVALIAGGGAERWRSVGCPSDPGSVLVTVCGAVGRPGVREVPTGMALRDLLSEADAGTPSAVLVGGYFGTFLRPEELDGTTLDREGLAGVGAALGCGVLAALPAWSCPLAEAARVLRWLAAQSARQCGPCANGLPAMAGALEAVVAGDPSGRARLLLERWSGQVAGRGACQLPDGAVRLVASALRAFADHAAGHAAYGPCPAVDHPAVLTLPGPLPPADAPVPDPVPGRPAAPPRAAGPILASPRSLDDP